tara:strand:+ start:520 stop:810 length:291 start_codon:yes stop_codon:yes gene_type:complete
MAKYNQIGKGAAFTREKTNQKQPDFGGTVNIMDKEFQISLWKSRTKKGDPYLSIQFSERIEEEGDSAMSGPWDNEGSKGSQRDVFDQQQAARKDHQ